MIKNKDLKRRIVEISYKLKLGHIGSCLTAVDIIDEIYKIKKPDEKFVLSAGHAHLAHLVVMEKYVNEYSTSEALYRKLLTCESLVKRFGIHCDRRAGCDVSTGSLGHGIGIAVGMALAKRQSFDSQIQDSCPTRECEHQRMKNVYCLLSDGEFMEGSVTESIRIMNENKLTNLKLYINNNGWAAYRQLPMVRDEIPAMMRFINTNMNDYPEWLQGQIAHYKVLNESEYNELMELLK